jgi:ABC-type branched-subunit amino acid transport system ATPase component
VTPAALRVTHDVEAERIEVHGGEVVLVPDWVPAFVAGPPLGPGRILLAGRDVSRWDVARRANAGLVVLGDVPVAGDVNIRDHLAAIDPSCATRVLRDAPLLAGRGDDLAGWLSGGERQVLGWLQTILTEPSVVVLDVAGRGLDQPTLLWAGEQIERWVAAGVAVAVHAGRVEEERWARPMR